jgi:phospholipid transport system substrate-binding protein
MPPAISTLVAAALLAVIPGNPAAGPAAGPVAKPAAKAAPRPADPVTTLRQGEARLRDALAAGETGQRLGPLLAEYVDYEELARRSLGRHWASQKPADRAALVQALRALLEATYLPRLQPGGDASTVVTLRRQAGADAELALVATTGEKQVPLELRMLRGKDGRWRVYDATVAGLAILEGYQEQFPQLLELGGMKRLLAQLETERKAELAKGAPP